MAWQCIKNKIGFFETSFFKCFSFFSKVKPYIKKYKFYSFQWHFTFNYFQRLIKANNHIFFSQYPVFALPFFFFLMFFSSLNVRYMYIYPQSLFIQLRLDWAELNWTELMDPVLYPEYFWAYQYLHLLCTLLELKGSYHGLETLLEDVLEFR